MQNKKHSRKREEERDLRLEDLLVDEEGVFDEEDEDSVTEDTLEFLSLNDDMIEEYNRNHESMKHKAGAVSAYRNHEDEYEDEDYEEFDNRSFYDDYESPTYGRYAGSYAQDEMGYSDDDIDTIFDGDPDAYWNID